jgi:hypothetical protein
MVFDLDAVSLVDQLVLDVNNVANIDRQIWVFDIERCYEHLSYKGNVKPQRFPCLRPEYFVGYLGYLWD